MFEILTSGFRRWLALTLLALAGCNLAREVVELPGDAVHTVVPGSSEDHPIDLVELQQKLLRFADSNQTSLTTAIDRLRRDVPTLEPKTILQMKLGLASATISMASGANARENLVDMTVFVTLTRMAVQNHWQPKVFGDGGLPLLETCRENETNIWRLAALVLKPVQRQELISAIEIWERAHPPTQSILAVRAAGFAAELTKQDKEKSQKSDSMWSFLSLDPMAGLDPAVRELTQGRLLAERALFVAQKLPGLLRWQTELFSVNMLEMPEVRDLTTATTRASASAERIAATAEKLPDRITREREELVKALEGQEKVLSPMVHEVRQTVEAGTKLTETLNATLKALDEVMKRIAENGKGGPPPEPFHIQDYTKAVVQAEATAKQLTEALATADHILASGNIQKLTDQVTPTVQRAESGARDVLDFAFKRALLLVLAVLAAALLYKVVAVRLAPPGKS